MPRPTSSPAETTAPPAPLAPPPEFAGEQLVDRMGVEITSWDRDRVVGTMPVTGNRQPYGLLHGGANAVLAETLGSVAAALHSLPERVPVGLELVCTHHRAVTTGSVTGVCTPLSVGRTVATFEVVISDEDGRRTCTARLTCLLRDHPPGLHRLPAAGEHRHTSSPR